MVVETAERSEYMGFTEPHTKFAWHIITIGDRGIGPDSLENHNVTTIRDYAIESWLDEHRPDVQYASAGSHTEAMTSLADGTSDAFLGSWDVASHYAAELGIEDIYDAGTIGSGHDMRIGYRGDMPILGAIMQDVVDQMPEDRKAAID